MELEERRIGDGANCPARRNDDVSAQMSSSSSWIWAEKPKEYSATELTVLWLDKRAQSYSKRMRYGVTEKSWGGSSIVFAVPVLSAN